MKTADEHRRRRREAPEIGSFMRRMFRALVARAAEGDTEALEVLADLEKASTAALGEAMRAAHARGYSWTELADLVGVTRQAARQRFHAIRQIADKETP